MKPWVEAPGRSPEVFTDVTKLVEAFGIVEIVLGCHQSLSHDLPSRSAALNCLRNSLTDEPHPEGSNSVGVGTLKTNNKKCSINHFRRLEVIRKYYLSNQIVIRG